MGRLVAYAALLILIGWAYISIWMLLASLKAKYIQEEPDKKEKTEQSYFWSVVTLNALFLWFIWAHPLDGWAATLYYLSVVMLGWLNVLRRHSV